VLDLISFYAFDQNSDLYKKLVLEEQKVQSMFPFYADHRDPFLFSVIARVKEEKDVGYVEEQILSTVEKLRNEAVPAEKLEAVKSHLRYSFALGMDSTGSMASTLAHFLSLEPTPETVNKRYALYQKVTPEDVRAVANQVFIETGRTIATLKHQPGAAETGGAH
jgi:zinc protease